MPGVWVSESCFSLATLQNTIADHHSTQRGYWSCAYLICLSGFKALVFPPGAALWDFSPAKNAGSCLLPAVRLESSRDTHLHQGAGKTYNPYFRWNASISTCQIVLQRQPQIRYSSQSEKFRSHTRQMCKEHAYWCAISIYQMGNWGTESLYGLFKAKISALQNYQH